MRKILSILMITVLLLLPATAFAEPEAEGGGQEAAAAEEGAEGGTDGEEGADADSGPTEFDESKYNIESFMLVDKATGEVLYEKEPSKKVWPSSTTKLMTALLLMESKGIEGETTVGAEVNVPQGSSLVLDGLIDGETITIKDLLYGLMVCSGNDAANAIAVYVSGSVEAFVELMNQRAAELGMTGTHYVNAHGLFISRWDDMDPMYEDSLGIYHYTTAEDMAKLTQEVMNHPEVMAAAGEKTYQLSPTNKHAYEGERPNGLPAGTIEQSNRLIYTNVKSIQDGKGYEKYVYEYATGMKTGWVQRIQPDDSEELISSYGCLVASAEKDGMELIAVSFGDLSEDALDRWQVSIDLFEYGFNNFGKADVSSYILPVSTSQQIGGYAENDPNEGKVTVNSKFTEPLPTTIPVDKATAEGLADGSITVEQDIRLNGELTAPVEEGEEVGTVAYLLNGEEIYTAPLVADRTVYAVGEEEQTSEEYNVPETETFKYWWLFIVIPAGAVGAIVIAKVIDSKRNAGMRYRRSASYGDSMDDIPMRSAPPTRTTRGRYYDPRGNSKNGPRHRM